MGEDAGADGGAIPQASQEGDDKASAPDEPEPWELFGDDPYKVEDEETSVSKEWEPGERFGIVEDEDASASEELEPEVRFGYEPLLICQLLSVVVAQHFHTCRTRGAARDTHSLLSRKEHKRLDALL